MQLPPDLGLLLELMQRINRESHETNLLAQDNDRKLAEHMGTHTREKEKVASFLAKYGSITGWISLLISLAAFFLMLANYLKK
jgi:hypothetical protein